MATKSIARKMPVPPVSRTSRPAPKPLARKVAPAATATRTASAPVKAAKAAQPKVTETSAAIAWDMFPSAEVVTYTRTVAPRVDREASTPAIVKAGLIKGFELTTAKGLDAKGKEQSVTQVQRCGTAAGAEAFEKAAKAYAKFRGWTLRGRILTDSELNSAIQRQSLPAGTPSGSVYSFAVKSREVRTRA